MPAYRWCGFRREACNGVSVLRTPLGAGAVMPRLYGIFRRVLYRVENFLLRLADRVSTIAPAMGRRAVEKGATSQRTWLAPNCADIRAIAPGPRDNAVRRELGFDAGHLLVLYAGGMGAKQGLGVVRQAGASTITARLQQPCFRQAGVRPLNPRLGPGRSER
ncbi:MAG: hypothetical protein EPO03_09015 [Porticoccaceae bacterium]|nr:MAG: hypothetical protein EPO03_09015 [Porticoccaceae bacterium]